MKKSFIKGLTGALVAFALVFSSCSDLNSVESESNEVSVVSESSRAAVNFTGNKVVSDSSDLSVTVTGNYSTSKGSVSVDGKSYTTCVKMESSTSVKVTVKSSGTLKLYFKEASKKVSVAGKTYTTDSNGVVSISVSSGNTYEIKKVDSINLFVIKLETSGSSSSSSSSSSGSSSSTSTSTAEFNADNLSHGTFSSNVTSGSFTVYATSAKTVSTPYTAATLNGKSFKQTLALGGGGSYGSYRAIGFNAAKGATVTVYASGASGRYLALATKSGVESKKEVSSSVAAYTFTTATAGTYNLYSTASGINVFYISVTGASSSSSSGSSSSSSSSSSGSSSSGSTSGSTGSAGSSTGISISANKTQSGVGTASRLREITSVSQIKSAIVVSSASDFTNALTKVVNGGAIVLNAGTYKFSSQVTISSSNNGSSSAMKYIMAAPGAKVVLDFSGESYNTKDTSVNDRGLQINGDYWHVYGISICGAADNGMYIAGNNNIIENCVFYNNRDTGLQIAREKSSMSSMSDWPSYNLILNCTAYDNADPATGENADGFACKLTAGPGNVFDGCIAYCNCDDGWDLYAKSATGSIGVVTIRNCVAFNNGRLTTNSSYANGDMNGFKLGGSNGAVPTAHVVSNCLAFNNGHDGFTDNGNGGALSLTNCTSYNNAKVNFNFYRTNKGTFTGMVTGAPNNSDKYGTSSVASTLSKSVYYTNNKYYWIDGATSVTNGQKNIGTQVSAPSFKSTAAPALNSSVHANYRNADGTVKMGNLFVSNDSSHQGCKFGSQAATVKGVSLATK